MQAEVLFPQDVIDVFNEWARMMVEGTISFTDTETEKATYLREKEEGVPFSYGPEMYEFFLETHLRLKGVEVDEAT